MSRINDDKALAVPATDGWDEIPETGSSLIVGSVIKFDFNNKSWTCDKAKIVDEDDTYAVLDAKAVWCRWGEDRKRPEQRVTQPGQRHPTRDELPDNDKEEWPLGLKGQPEDPWKDNRYVLLVNTLTAAKHTFIGDTYGVRRCVSDLKTQITDMRRVHPGAIPIVTLRSTMMPTGFGLKPRPWLKVESWRRGPDLDETVPALPERSTPRTTVLTHPKSGQKRDVIDDGPPPHDRVPDGDPDDDIPF